MESINFANPNDTYLIFQILVVHLHSEIEQIHTINTSFKYTVILG